MHMLIPITNPRAKHVEVTDDELIVQLADGRTIIRSLAWFAPLAWFACLLAAGVEQRRQWEIPGDG